jgi:hypothetical protein
MRNQEQGRQWSAGLDRGDDDDEEFLSDAEVEAGQDSADDFDDGDDFADESDATYDELTLMGFRSPFEFA